MHAAAVKKILLILTCLSLLSGCSLTPLSNEPMSDYLLAPQVKVKINPASSTQAIILIMPIQAAPGYTGNAMIYINKDYQWQHYVKHRWVAPPAEMLKALFVRALEDTRHFQAVVAAPFGGQYDYQLNSQLLAFQQDFRTYPSQVQLTLSVQLIAAASGKIMANRAFEVRVAAPRDNPYGGVMAANQAVEQLLQQLAAFVLASTT